MVRPPLAGGVADCLKAERLTAGQEAEVLEFLNRQPLKNVTIIGSVEEHGLSSPHHRGVFYGYREGERLAGIALIGHWVLLSGEARAAATFAAVARRLHESEVEIVLGEESSVRVFDRAFTAQPCVKRIRSTRPQRFFSIHEVKGLAFISDDLLRPARVSEIEEVVEAHARACLEVHGQDKAALDPVGFRQRTLERVEAGRVWIARDARGVVFKVDVVVTTRDAFYLEGIWTRPDMRGRGFSTRIFKLLCHKLLRLRPAICLFADAEDVRAMGFYQGVGFRVASRFRLTRYEALLDQNRLKCNYQMEVPHDAGNFIDRGFTEATLDPPDMA